jgi:hypothetical protein
MLEVTRDEFVKQIEAYRLAGLTVVEVEGMLGQVYFMAGGKRVGRRTTCKWVLDCPLKLEGE